MHRNILNQFPSLEASVVNLQNQFTVGNETITFKYKHIERLLGFVEVNELTGCWVNNNFQRDKDGYGRFTINSKIVLMHRFSYFIFNQINPAELMVCHRCDNPKCLRPDHLFLDTVVGNHLDRVAKGRLETVSGENNINAKLNQDIVNSIRQEYLLVKDNVVLAKKYNVSKVTIGHIVRNKTWFDKDYQTVIEQRQQGSVLTEEQIQEVKDKYSIIRNYEKVGLELKISKHKVAAIIKGENWNNSTAVIQQSPEQLKAIHDSYFITRSFQQTAKDLGVTRLTVTHVIKNNLH